MDFPNSIFQRIKFEQIFTFFLEGIDNFDDDIDTYANRLEKGRDTIFKRLECICQNEEEFNTACADLSDVLITYESVYTEIGIKLGARLLFEILLKNDNLEDDDFNKS